MAMLLFRGVVRELGRTTSGEENNSGGRSRGCCCCRSVTTSVLWSFWDHLGQLTSDPVCEKGPVLQGTIL